MHSSLKPKEDLHVRKREEVELRSKMSFITRVVMTCNLQCVTKVLRHLAIKLIFERLGHILPPSSPNNVDFSTSSITDHSAYTTLNWGAGGITELTLDASKIEQVPTCKYRKASFPKSVSTTFVTHCSLTEHFKITGFCRTKYNNNNSKELK